MANVSKDNFPTFQAVFQAFKAISWKRFLKGIIVFTSLFIVVFIWADNTRSLGLYEEDAFYFALGISVVISFVWDRIAKKFNL